MKMKVNKEKKEEKAVLFSLHPFPGHSIINNGREKKDEREKREDLSFNFLFPFISCFLHPQTMKKA